MAKIQVIIDQEANTVNVWFDDPAKEHVCEETGDEIILVKDKDGKVIGFEKLNYVVPQGEKSDPVETMVV